MNCAPTPGPVTCSLTYWKSHSIHYGISTGLDVIGKVISKTVLAFAFKGRLIVSLTDTPTVTLARSSYKDAVRG